jgi:rhomboid protease GluP
VIRQPAHSRPTPLTVTLLAGLAVLYLVSLIPGGISLSTFINGPTINELVKVGANARVLTFEDNQFWRLITAALLHGGFVHILLNGLALWNLGGQLEEHIGAEEVLLTFAVTGIIASVSSATFGDPRIVSIGASGAICGLFGFICAIGTRNLRQLFGQLQRNAINIVMLLGLGFLIPNVDNWAHVGGIVSGLALGYFYRRPTRATRSALALVSGAVLVYGAYKVVAGVYPALAIGI